MTEQTQPPTENDVDRRQFINGTWKVLGVALVAEAAWTSYDILHPKPAEGFGGMVEVGSVSDYAQEGAVQYFLNGRFYVTQYQGGLRAIYQKCPHLGCRVPYCDSAQQFQCPCHGSIYNVIGEYLQGPAPRGMDRFPISIQSDGTVMVDTSTIVEGPPRGVLEGPSTAAGPTCITPEGEAGGTSPSPSGSMGSGGMSS
jgi:cytochrome b6-f complex iron-sulfur subunit